MRASLKLHPDYVCEAVSGIHVDVERCGLAKLSLLYRVEGSISDLRLPERTPSSRADNLWQHTCLEAFFLGDGGGYCEFNFAPSTKWASYSFDSYRSGMADLEISPPQIDVRAGEDLLELQVELELPGSISEARLALSVVVEEANGRKSYWALAHPPGKADFHHPDSFVCEL